MNIRNIFDPRINYLLGAFTKSEFKILALHLELLKLSNSEILCEAYG